MKVKKLDKENSAYPWVLRDIASPPKQLYYIGAEPDKWLPYTISAPDWAPILSSGASNWVADKGTVMAAAEMKYGKGMFRICEVQLVDRILFNPTAYGFLQKILN